MTLDKTQIFEIKELVNKQSIWYNDIKEELVDHIASEVEQQMQQGADFKEALSQVTPQINFKKIQRERLKYEHIRAMKDVLTEMKSFLAGPRLLILISLAALQGVLYLYFPENAMDLQIATVMILVIMMVYYLGIPWYLAQNQPKPLSNVHYMSRINAIYSSSLIISALIGLFRTWYLEMPGLGLAVFVLFYWFAVAGWMVMRKTLRDVRAQEALRNKEYA